jgi:hypothetical protein
MLICAACHAIRRFLQKDIEFSDPFISIADYAVIALRHCHYAAFADIGWLIFDAVMAPQNEARKVCA